MVNGPIPGAAALVSRDVVYEGPDVPTKRETTAIL
jgi:hypothetical protein